MKQGDADVAIIDYGMGNLRSVAKAFEKLGSKVTVSDSAKVIAQAKRVVLPGVGAFGDCMSNLRRFGLDEAVYAAIDAGKPFMGICLGLQLLFEGSEEDPGVKGLSVFPGFVKKIAAPGLKIPHMGWNKLQFPQNSDLFSGLPADSFVYFVHSYHALPDDQTLLTTVTAYGGTVTAAVGHGNVQAVQFHPEKSSSAGMTILKNFLAMT
jgi:glutamine amidotransferase